MSSITLIEEFLELYKSTGRLLIDARSEGEYGKGHIPGAVNIPLLNNENRAIVGTTYKQKGRKEAVIKGFELSGPLFHSMILKVNEINDSSNVMVYCWRGGMRSAVLCWILEMAGIKTTILKGGYKQFRNWSLSQFTKDRNLVILGGKTGSGKTEMLKIIKDEGEQVVCLETLASHRGSAFGSLGQATQPSQEHFENMLAFQLGALNPERPLWLENESRNIGVIKIPDALFEQMRKALVIEMNVPRPLREARILNEYGSFSKEELNDKTIKLIKRMGGQNVKESVQRLMENNLPGWLNPLLDYYDRTYSFGNELRNPEQVVSVDVNWSVPQLEAQQLINAQKK
jgi:tRNA 2-selenouridine synthase